MCGEASDGVEAISKVMLLQPDIVLMDISIPRMDGFRRLESFGGTCQIRGW